MHINSLRESMPLVQVGVAKDSRTIRDKPSPRRRASVLSEGLGHMIAELPTAPNHQPGNKHDSWREDQGAPEGHEYQPQSGG